VIDSNDTAEKVSGSIVQATKLTDKFIGLSSVVIVAAAFIIVSLLTVFAINKRTREIGTLKAIGWSKFAVIRQILSENIVLGVMGAMVGVGLGVTAIAILNHYDISFTASVESLNSSGGMFGFGGPRMNQSQAQTVSTVDTSVALDIGYSYLVILLGSLVALLGALVSGFFAALKVSRLKPQVALRNLE
jgi:ABC-type antimicrobial peptide transport system permease subunit